MACGTASGCDAALRPRGKTRVARTGHSRRAVAQPRGRRPRDHAVHVGARVGRHVARMVSGGPTGIVGPGKYLRAVTQMRYCVPLFKHALLFFSLRVGLKSRRVLPLQVTWM